MLAENIDQWKDQYRKEGYAEGFAIGCIEGAGLALRDLLEALFGALPDSVTSYIENFSDLDALIKFDLFASQAPSLQSVIDRIKLMTGTDCSGQTVQPA